mgnify:CR=1 FL=1
MSERMLEDNIESHDEDKWERGDRNLLNIDNDRKCRT